VYPYTSQIYEDLLTFCHRRPGHTFHFRGQVSKVVAELQAFAAVRELIPHCIVGECAYLRKVLAVPGLHRGEAVARMGEGQHLAEARGPVAVQVGDVVSVG